MQTTRWVDNETKTLETAINLIIKHEKAEISSSDTIYKDWQIEKAFDENLEIVLNNRKIYFNYISYSYNMIYAGDQPEEDRTTINKGFIIPYHNGVNVNYIISKNSNASSLLRRLLGYSGKNEIQKNGFRIGSDIFVWLIYKVYKGDNILETDSFGEKSKCISIDQIKGFKGNTDDLLTRVSAHGESVMNIISTLSFLLESKNLNQINLDIKYGEHRNIELTLNTRETVITAIDKYVGEFEKEEDISRELLTAKLYLLIYLEVLPFIIQIFRDEIENSLWSREKYIDFLSEVANELSERVAEKIAILKTNSNTDSNTDSKADTDQKVIIN